MRRPPPRFFERLLAIACGAPGRPVVGDLAQEHAELQRRWPLWRCHLWYRFEVARSLVPALWMRRTHRASIPTLERPMNTLRRDIRLAFRSWRRAPGVTIASILTLALGVGANVAVFSLVAGVLLRPLPFSNGETVVHIEHPDAAAGGTASVIEFERYARAATSFDALAEYHQQRFNLVGRGDAERVRIGVVSSNYFDVLGVEPRLGRGFTTADGLIGSAPVLLLDFDYWQRQHGGDPDVLGQTWQMNGKGHLVIGILPPLPQFPDGNDVYMTVAACPIRQDETSAQDPDVHFLTLLGSLATGRDLAAAAAELATLDAQMTVEYPETHEQAPAPQLVPLRERMTAGFRSTLMLVTAIATLLLLLTLANVANLTMVALARRTPELILQLALGARRSSLVRQLVIESLLKTVLGAAAALVTAVSLLGVLRPFAARWTVRAPEISIDAPVMAYALAIAAVAGLLFGTVPVAALLRGRSPSDVLRSASTTISGSGLRLRGVFVAVQAGACVVVLVAAGLTIRTIANLYAIDAGVDFGRVLTLSIDLSSHQYPDLATQLGFYQPLLERLEAHADVESAALSWTFPLNSRGTMAGGFDIEGLEPSPDRSADYRLVSAGYFDTLGLALLRGRMFGPEDELHEADTMIINRAMADRYWPDADPLGARISFGGPPRTVVGVVSDTRQHGLTSPPEPGAYITIQSGHGMRRTSLLVRTAGAPLERLADVRAIVRDLDSDQALSDVRTLEQVRHDALAAPRTLAEMLAAFAALGVAVGAAGVAGVVGVVIAQRQREIGVRLALGSGRARAALAAIRSPLGYVVGGTSAGVAATLLGAGWLRGFVHGVAPYDPLVLAVAVATVIAVSALAAYQASKGILRRDLVVALRNE